jgi:hypothetical protein
MAYRAAGANPKAHRRGKRREVFAYRKGFPLRVLPARGAGSFDSLGRYVFWERMFFASLAQDDGRFFIGAFCFAEVSSSPGYPFNRRPNSESRP